MYSVTKPALGKLCSRPFTATGQLGTTLIYLESDCLRVEWGGEGERGGEGGEKGEMRRQRKERGGIY